MTCTIDAGVDMSRLRTLAQSCLLMVQEIEDGSNDSETFGDLSDEADNLRKLADHMATEAS